LAYNSRLVVILRAAAYLENMSFPLTPAGLSRTDPLRPPPTLIGTLPAFLFSAMAPMLGQDCHGH